MAKGNTTPAAVASGAHTASEHPKLQPSKARARLRHPNKNPPEEDFNLQYNLPPVYMKPSCEEILNCIENCQYRRGGKPLSHTASCPKSRENILHPPLPTRALRSQSGTGRPKPSPGIRSLAKGEGLEEFKVWEFGIEEFGFHGTWISAPWAWDFVLLFQHVTSAVRERSQTTCATCAAWEQIHVHPQAQQTAVLGGLGSPGPLITSDSDNQMRPSSTPSGLRPLEVLGARSPRKTVTAGSPGLVALAWRLAQGLRQLWGSGSSGSSGGREWPPLGVSLLSGRGLSSACARQVF